MMRYLLFIFIFLQQLGTYSFVSQDTTSIQGNIAFSDDGVSGDFFYSIKNNSLKAMDSWVVIVNPAVHILSIRQNDREARVNIQHGYNYRVLVITLPDKIKANSRSLVNIRFAIDPQIQNPRFKITEDSVFLDARSLWFPIPNQDLEADISLNIETPKELHSVIGHSLKSEAIIIDKRITSWTNDQRSISPSMSLVITPQKREYREFISVYTDYPTLADQIYKELLPFWEQLQSSYKAFELSEIHLVPMDIASHEIVSNQHADGEFLGNLFLIDPTLLQTFIENPDKDFELAGNTKLRLTETILHEIFHSYFPGLVAHEKEDYLYIESLVQFLTWNLIQQVNPIWGQQIFQRSKFLFFNLLINQKNPALQEFIYNTILLYISFGNSSFDGAYFADTLVEKYQAIKISKDDIINTINDFVPLENEIGTMDISKLKKNTLYDSALTLQQKDSITKITNQRREFQITNTTTTLQLSHDYPIAWEGTISYVSDHITNYIHLAIPPNIKWVTNINKKIDSAKTSSILDLLERDSSNNFYTTFNLGRRIITQINGVPVNIPLTIDNNLTNILETWKEQGLFLRWNNTFWDDKSFTIQAYLKSDPSTTVGFVIFTGQKTNNGYVINKITHPFEY